MRNVVQLSLAANNILRMRSLLRENGSFLKNVHQKLLDKGVAIVICMSMSMSMSILYLAMIKTRGYKYACNAARRYWVSEKRWTDIRLQLIDMG